PAGRPAPQACADGAEKLRRGVPLRLIVLLGLLGYAVAQGLQYVGQSYLTPTQSSLCLSVGNTAMVMLADRLWLRENQTGLDLVKLAALLGGIALYYYPWGAASLAPAGFLFMALSSVGYAAQMTLNRRLLRAGDVPPRALVAGPMLVGGAVLLAAGLALEGPPPITGQLVLMLLYLGGVSGALGFHLWTSSQSSLTAFESSGINNLMLVEIALMDWLAFRRTFSALQIAAILLVFGAIVWIQTGRNTPKRKTPDPEPGRT
ncbi:MAG: DMT family transporter, partial [Clostridiales bacterium]|nr:DMT family transporter [Clostridiales bacterium]